MTDDNNTFYTEEAQQKLEDFSEWSKSHSPQATDTGKLRGALMKDRIKADVWEMFSKTWNVYGADGPTSDKQKRFVDQIADYVNVNWGNAELIETKLPGDKLTNKARSGRPIKRGRGRPKGARNR